MTAMLLTALFAACAALALASIFVSLHRYGPAALRLRCQAHACPETLTVRWSVTQVNVHVASATVLRPDFAVRAVARAPRPALRVAA